MNLSLNSSAGATTPYWSQTAATPTFPSLKENTETDVCVVGAGIAGLTTAYLLAVEGKKVTVLEDGKIVSGETQRTTAHITNALDDRYYELERLHGEFGSKLAASSHTAAINEIERIVKQEKIACDFERVDGYLFVPPDQSTDVLEKELAAAHRAGLKDIKLQTTAALNTYDLGVTLHFPHQAQFNPLHYLFAVAKSIEKQGGRVYQGTHVSSVEGDKQATVTTKDGHTVRADSVVIATNAPINDNFAIYTRQAPYRTYVVGLKIPKGAVRKALYWDTADPYHYMRIAHEEDHDVLIVGGEDHKTGQATDGGLRFSRLETWARTRVPQAQELLYSWSGQVMEPIDGLAFIGRNPLDAENIFIATGDSGNGITHGTIAGMLLRDLILDRKNPWQDLYDPSRVNVRSAKEFLKESANVATELLEWVKPGESEDQMQPDSGRVVRRGLKRIAIYCDTKGAKHELSAVCRHKGCIVAWNPTEKTWDCPCHGSRYETDGTVINGPSSADLSANT